MAVRTLEFVENRRFSVGFPRPESIPIESFGSRYIGKTIKHCYTIREPLCLGSDIDCISLYFLLFNIFHISEEETKI